MSCEGCSIRFTILKRKRKCDDCGFIFCSDCSSPKSKLYQCYRCKILTCVPLDCNEVASLKLRDLQWFLDFKGIDVPRNDLREKAILVDRIMNYSRERIGELPASQNIQSFYSPLIERDNVGGLFNRSTSAPSMGEHQLEGNSNQGIPCDSGANQTASNQGANNQSATNQSNTSDDKVDASIVENCALVKKKYQIINLDSIDNYDQIFNLSIMELKLLLTRNSVSFRGCCEKSELQEKVVWLWKLQEGANNKNAIPDENLCKICMEENINSLLLDCGHMLTCFQCGKRLHDCPICRQIIVRVVRAFKS